MLVGGLSGAFTTSIGMPGPPILLYFSGTDTQKEKLRATTLAFYLFIYLISLILQVIFVGTNKVIWVLSLWALSLVFMGLYLDQLLFKMSKHVHLLLYMASKEMPPYSQLFFLYLW